VQRRLGFGPAKNKPNLPRRKGVEISDCEGGKADAPVVPCGQLRCFFSSRAGLHIFGNKIHSRASYFGNMGSRVRKQTLSSHQKQIWLLTVLCIFGVSLFMALIFWLANQPDSPGR